MSIAKRPPLPLILMAQDLLDGRVRYWSKQGWSTKLIEALQATNPQDADALEIIGQREYVNNKVVDVNLVDIDTNGTPKHYREKIKSTGLTITAF